MPVLERERVLIAGASGYVGGRLTPALVAAGARVRCLARRPEALAGRVGPDVEVVRGDLLDPGSLPPALEGITTAVYLVHSMGEGGDFEEMDRAAARSFGAAARRAGVRRIVYLGGLGDPDARLSTHLRSRHEVGEVLRESGVEVVELRAAVVIGAGSLSFEMVRSLVERLPVMVTPRWVRVPTQPIHVGDLLAYLLAAIRWDGSGSRTFDIGGPDVVSYGDLMREYARQRGLRRWMVPVPFLSPRLSGLWLGLVTPLYARIGRALIASIENPTVVRPEFSGEPLGVRPVGMEEAIRRALKGEDAELVEGTPAREGPPPFATRRFDRRTLVTAAPPEAVFAAIERIGGANGWYAADALWRLRGWLDEQVGGVGLRRGRPHPDHLAVGDTVDCWRVEAIEPGRRLFLAAEMKVPGRAWLEFEVEPRPAGGSLVRQTAIFDPYGLFGLGYWYALLPLHEIVFTGMIRGVVRRAEGTAPPSGRWAEA